MTEAGPSLSCQRGPRNDRSRLPRKALTWASTINYFIYVLIILIRGDNFWAHDCYSNEQLSRIYFSRRIIADKRLSDIGHINLPLWANNIPYNGVNSTGAAFTSGRQLVRSRTVNIWCCLAFTKVGTSWQLTTSPGFSTTSSLSGSTYVYRYTLFFTAANVHSTAK